jgi:hypothetical protein
MTVRHIVLFRFTDSASDEQIAALSAGLDALPTAIAEIRSYIHGRDLGLRAGNWDYGVVAQFDSVEDFHVYREHPDHQALVRDLLDPISEERASVQLDR